MLQSPGSARPAQPDDWALEDALLDAQKTAIDVIGLNPEAEAPRKTQERLVDGEAFTWERLPARKPALGNREPVRRTRTARAVAYAIIRLGTYFVPNWISRSISSG